jgi:hypothetical protein
VTESGILTKSKEGYTSHNLLKIAPKTPSQMLADVRLSVHVSFQGLMRHLGELFILPYRRAKYSPVHVGNNLQLPHLKVRPVRCYQVTISATAVLRLINNFPPQPHQELLSPVPLTRCDGKKTVRRVCEGEGGDKEGLVSR